MHRSPPQRERDAAQKPKPDNDSKPKDKVAEAEKPEHEDHDDVTATDKTSAKTKESTANDNTAKAATDVQPTDQVNAVGLEVLQSVAIQFQILVQTPNGDLQDMGTFDLKSMLAAASQDSQLASALEAAFGQAADSLAAGQSLLGELAQATGIDPAAIAATQDLAAAASVDGTDTTNVADLFKQIAAAFRPLAHQAIENAAATQATKTAASATANMAQHLAGTNELVAPEVAEQSQALSQILGDDNKIRIQVAVNGRTVADIPFQYGQFNRYSGYNPEATRTASTANGQAGQGAATNTIVAAEAAAGELLQPQTASATSATSTTPATATAAVAIAAPSAANGFQTSTNSQQNNGAGTMPREATPVRAPETATPTAAANNSSSPQQQPTSFAAALNQTNGNTATTQASATERPAPTQSQQVIEQIKVNITRAAKAGLDRVTIQLKPIELGRIEIKLEMSSEGKVTAAVTADNPETLNLLQREARGLERALQDAGLRADANDLEFSLRNEDQPLLADKGDERNAKGNGSQQSNAHMSDAEIEADDMYDYAQAASARGGVDTYV